MSRIQFCCFRLRVAPRTFRIPPKQPIGRTEKQLRKKKKNRTDRLTSHYDDDDDDDDDDDGDNDDDDEMVMQT